MHIPPNQIKKLESSQVLPVGLEEEDVDLPPQCSIVLGSCGLLVAVVRRDSWLEGLAVGDPQRPERR